MLDQAPGSGLPEDQLPPEEEAPPDVPPAEVPPEAPPPPPAPPQPGPADQVMYQGQQAAGQLQAAEQELARQFATLDAQERAATQQIQPLIQQLQSGAVSPDQVAPILEAYNRDRQQRLQAAEQIRHGAQELQQIKMRVGYELQEQHRRATLEPFAKQTGIQLLLDEAAQKSGDPANFNKKKLARILERTPPDAWRAVQEAAVDDHREQRLATRADTGVDEMGGTGTTGPARDNATALDDIAAGLRQYFPRS